MNRTDFTYFFQEATGHDPFAWQTRLLDHVLETGTWPTTISAPTGAGKTSAIHVHVFVNALAANGSAPRVCRRLVMTVNRRALVDSHQQVADSLLQRLEDASSGILKAVADSLRSLATSESAAQEPFRVTALRGGVVPDPQWLEDASLCQIICATPDMVGSRLLFRGYGASRGARPREAGLLGMDTVIVLDEAHLNRQLLRTARRVSAMSADSAALLAIPALQVAETTATPADGPGGLGVTDDDLSEELLATRLTSPKPVRVRTTTSFPTKGKPTAAYVDIVADEVGILVAEAGQRTVGCFVNRVATATAVAQALRMRGLTIALWTGPMRPMDLEELKGKHAGLFTVDGDPTIDVLIATQTVEVGVDIDLYGLVTEVAAGAALAQRSGRVNRVGARPSGPITVLAPVTPEASPPYTHGEIAETMGWLQRRLTDPNGLSPWAMRSDPPPPAQLGRVALHRLERAEVRLFESSGERLFAEPDLEIWLRDNLEEEPYLGVVLRNDLERDDAEAVAMLRAMPPHERETFPVRIPMGRQVLAKVLAAAESRWARAFLLREGEWSVLRDETPLNPGDVLILDNQHAVTMQGVIDPAATAREPIDVAYGAPGTRLVTSATEGLPGPWPTGDELLEAAAELEAEELVAELQSSLGPDHQLFIPPATEDERGRPVITWLVWSELQPDDEARQIWTPSRGAVPLGSHEEAVALRAATVCERLGLKAELGQAVVLAARHHDAGKADPRFQVSLGASSGELLAKSRFRSRQTALRARTASGLPLGWRHEQASVLYADSVLPDSTRHRDLILRLVGTSHGHGRSTFAFSGRLGIPRADTWFGAGLWETLMEDTSKEWGPWGCAYLEAVLRSADTQISREGT